jgi:MFS family permease
LVAGGPLVQIFGWRVVFVLQACFSCLALALARVVLRETPRHGARFDVAGSLSLAVGVAGLMFALGESRSEGLDSPLIWGAVLTGLLGVATFVWVEGRVRSPLLPLRYFRRPSFSAPLVAGSFMGAAYMGAFVIAPIFLIQVFHYSIAATSGIMLMRTLTLTAASPLGGHLGGRIGERAASMLGSGIVAVSLVVVAAGALQTSLLVVCIGLVLQGLGNGIGGPPMTTAVAGSVDHEHLGVAAAASRLTSQVGVAFGITTLTMVYGGTNTGAAFARAFLVGAVFAACAMLASLRIGPRPSVAVEVAPTSEPAQRAQRKPR